MDDGKDSVRTRTTSWADPKTVQRTTDGRTGRELLEADVSGELPLPPIAATMGYRVAEAGDGTAVIVSEPGEHHLNPYHVIHGGLAATLIDTATGCAISTQSPPGVYQTTINLQVNFFRAMTEATGPVRCEARVIRRGRRIAVADAEVIGGDGTVYARGSATYMILESEP